MANPTTPYNNTDLLQIWQKLDAFATGGSSGLALETTLQLVKDALVSGNLQTVADRLASGGSSVAQLLYSLEAFFQSGTLVRETTLTNSAQELKNSSGSMQHFYAYNPNNTMVFLKFYDSLAINVVVGTTSIVKTIPLAPSSGLILTKSELLHDFATAISCSAVTGSADNDSTAPTSTITYEIHVK